MSNVDHEEFTNKMQEGIKAAVEAEAPKLKERIDMAILCDLVKRGHEDMVKSMSPEDYRELRARAELRPLYNGMMPVRQPDIPLLPNTFLSVKCATCHQERSLEKLERCSRCKKVYYCDSVCQRNHWYRHKSQCK